MGRLFFDVLLSVKIRGVMSENKKTALIISGGGAKGSFGVGVLEYLYRKYRNTGWFSITGGTSTGALIAPMAALMAAPEPMGTTVLKTLARVYTSVRTPDILKKTTRLDCLNETGPLYKLLKREFKREWFDWLQKYDSPVCYVVYVNFQTGQKVVVTARDQGMTITRFIKAMVASSSVPVVMQATIINGCECYDGGVRDLLPFGKAIELGAETIVPIFFDPANSIATTKKFKRFDRILLRAFGIMLSEIGKNDVEIADLINIGISAKNDLLKAFRNDRKNSEIVNRIFNKRKYKPLFSSNKRVIDIIKNVRPNKTLTTDSLTFDPKKMRLWLAAGKKKAKMVFKKSPFL